MSKQPLWLTPERKETLIKLFSIYGNSCLLGHQACHDITHYINVKHKTVYIAKPYLLPCKGSDGNILRDDNGNPVYLTIYRDVKSIHSQAELIRLYDLITNELIQDWKDLDREIRADDWKLERKALHITNQRRLPLEGQFNAVSRDIYADNQPLFFLREQSLSGVTLEPFVIARMSSSYIRLHVNLSGILRQAGKNKRRKAIRYGKPLPRSIANEINRAVLNALRDYWES